MFIKLRLLCLILFIVSLPKPSLTNAQEDECEFAGEPIRIGATMPLSEPGAVASGEKMLWGFQFALSEVNARCGIEIDGVHHPVELIYEDTAGQAELGITAAEKLIHEDGVVAITGEYHSAVALAIMDVALTSNTPLLFTDAWRDDITGSGLPNVFRIAPTSSLVASGLTNWMLAQAFEHVVIVVENTEYGIGATEVEEANLSANGVMVDVILVDIDDPDAAEILEQLAVLDTPDAIYFNVVSEEAGYPLLREIINAGYMPTDETACVISQLALQPAFWEEIPNGQYCVTYDLGLTTANYNMTTSIVAEAYRVEFEIEPASYVFESYDSFMIVVDAIDRAESLEAEAIIAALETTDLTLSQGRYYFPYGSENPVPEDVPAFMWHQWPDPAILVLQYQELGQPLEETIVIYPDTYQTGEYIGFGEVTEEE